MRYVATITLLFVASLPAFAHRLHVSARVDADRVRIEAYYDDDTPAQEAKITILQGETVIVEGRTDDKGVFEFLKPNPGSYEVRGASTGHTAKEDFEIAELPSTEKKADVDDREEKTRTPWRRIGMGLGLILGVAIASFLLRRSTPRNRGTP